jgi:hypothetical protein
MILILKEKEKIKDYIMKKYPQERDPNVEL